MKHIGPIRNTHYGGFYDFQPDGALADTAYSTQALSAHTDTTYFTEPVGLQAFHMLSHTLPKGEEMSSGGKGGLSLLVDGFNVAKKVQAQASQDYETLKSVALPWHASGNEGIAIAPDKAYPVIEEHHGELHRVRWNNDDRGVAPYKDASKWYSAAHTWVSNLRDPTMEYWFQLQPGRLLSMSPTCPKY